jgi:AbrB family looped-hinge helix DNA binding protein
MALTGRRRPHLTTLAIRRKGIVTIPKAIREELDLHEGDHLVATVEDGRLILIPASVIPDDQAWFWTPEWQAKEEEADQEIADGGGPVMSQKAAFLRAVVLLVADLQDGRGFRKSLRVKKMAGYDDVWELTWAPDSRATFEYGATVKEDHPHVRWRRFGTHDIFKRP